MTEHFGLADFEEIEVSPCGCGCGDWVTWNDEGQQWRVAGPYRYAVSSPLYAAPPGAKAVAVIYDTGDDSDG